VTPDGWVDHPRARRHGRRFRLGPTCRRRTAQVEPREARRRPPNALAAILLSATGSPERGDGPGRRRSEHGHTFAAVEPELQREVERARDALAYKRGSVTLEARWIQPGPVPRPLLELLGPFEESAIERREDRYLLVPVAPLLSVKVRDRVQLDVKARHRRLGALHLDNDVHGRLEMWEKWSFPLAEALEVAGGLTLRKLRRKRVFAMVDGALVERPVAEAETACTVEVTEVSVEDGTWWTIGFEAGGDASTLEAELRATAAALVGRQLPSGVELGGNASMSYVHWLQRRHCRVERLR